MVEPDLPGAIAYRRHLPAVSGQQGFPAKQDSVADHTGPSPRVRRLMVFLASQWRRRPTRRAPFPRVL